jgi:hypothetical protein
MALSGWIAAKDLRLALSAVVYMAIFDDDRTKSQTTVDDSDQVKQVLALSAAEVASYLPALFAANAGPAQLPAQVSQLLAGAQLQYARVLSYQRRPEYVKTYGAQPGGKMEDLFRTKMERIQSSIQQVPAGDGVAADGSSPVPDPPNVGAIVTPDDHRIIVSDPDGTDNLGDF